MKTKRHTIASLKPAVKRRHEQADQLGQRLRVAVDSCGRRRDRRATPDEARIGFQHHWLSADQFTDIYSLGQISPGPNTNMVTVIGYTSPDLQAQSWH
jgi:hypothetical protein